MKIYKTIVIGGGPSGISCAYHLNENNIDYLLIEEKEMLHTWKNERWDSFHLVTPNWMTNLPGVDHLIPYDNNFMSKAEIEHVLQEYLYFVKPNYIEQTVIQSIDKMDDFYCLNTNRGKYYSEHLIVAVGMFNKPFIPKVSHEISKEINQIHSVNYFNPNQLKKGATIVVGSGRSGIQIALEVKENTAYDCYLSVGSLTPLPTIYKNINGVYWLNRLSGYKEGKEYLPYKHADLQDDNIINKLNQTLWHCQDAGVRIVGRLTSASDHKICFDNNLEKTLRNGHAYLKKIEGKINDLVHQETIDLSGEQIDFQTGQLDDATLNVQVEIDLNNHHVTNIIWCTGFKPDYKWLTLDIYDDEGNLKLVDDICTEEKVYFCSMSLKPDPDTKSSFGVGLFALFESAKRTVEAMLSRMGTEEKKHES